MSYSPKTLYRQDGVLLASAFADSEASESALRADGWGDFPEYSPVEPVSGPAGATPSADPQDPASVGSGASGGPLL